MTVTVTQNFDWADTKRKLVIFLPNHNGKELTEFSIQQIRTTRAVEDYLIIVGNDGVDDDFSHLATQNVAFFTLRGSQQYPRNGAFIRNYAIKRCQSELFFQKDGEVVIEGDFIRHSIDQHGSWRAGNIVVLDAEQTKTYLREKHLSSVKDIAFYTVPAVRPDIDLNATKQYICNLDGQISFISYFHYAYCTQTRTLQNLGGYDEDFTDFGWEDVDMYFRLAYAQEFLKPDYSCYAIHPKHASTVNTLKLGDMAQIFKNKATHQCAANLRRNWGEGA